MTDVMSWLRAAVAALDETTPGSLAEDMRRRALVSLVRELLTEVDDTAVPEGMCAVCIPPHPILNPPATAPTEPLGGPAPGVNGSHLPGC